MKACFKVLYLYGSIYIGCTVSIGLVTYKAECIQDTKEKSFILIMIIESKIPIRELFSGFCCCFFFFVCKKAKVLRIRKYICKSRGKEQNKKNISITDVHGTYLERQG
jgi:hypothetical protein